MRLTGTRKWHTVKAARQYRSGGPFLPGWHHFIPCIRIVLKTQPANQTGEMRKLPEELQRKQAEPEESDLRAATHPMRVGNAPELLHGDCLTGLSRLTGGYRKA